VIFDKIHPKQAYASASLKEPSPSLSTNFNASFACQSETVKGTPILFNREVKKEASSDADSFPFLSLSNSSYTLTKDHLLSFYYISALDHMLN
jgi:hypothetical protein